jgi:branched-chain amino acid transport system substrate-binding protein
MRSHRKSLAAIATVLALSTAACGGSRSGGSADADLGDAAPASEDLKCGLSNGEEATGDPIRIGAISTMSNGVDFSSSPLAAQAYFDCVNANGGINGRPIEYDSQDDGLDPQKGSALATQFANDDSVVAMAGSATFVSCGPAQPIYAAADLYDIAGVGVPRGCFFSANIAPVNGGPRLSMVSQAQYLVEEEGVTSIAAAGNLLPDLGEWINGGLTDYAAQAGIEVPYTDLAPPPLSDANSIAVKAGQAAPDAFIAGFTGPDNASLLQSALQQGLQDDIRWGCLTSCYDTSFPEQIGPDWNGKFTTNSEFTLLNAETEDNLNWRAVIAEYGTESQPRDSFSQAGYLAARILVDTLLELDPANITRETVSEAVVGIKNFTTDMMCTPWYFGEADRHNANHQLHNVRLDENGDFVQAQDCVETPDPELQPILDAEKADPSLIGG